jgi:benzoate membrane transport protein
MHRSLPPFPTWSTALIAALVGFTGTVPLIFEAMRSLGASVEQTGSAITALCLGVAVAGAALSYWSRMPIVLAWSTPGAALLAASMQGLAWPVAVGVFFSAALMMIAVGIVPALGRLADLAEPARPRRAACCGYEPNAGSRRKASATLVAPMRCK